MKMEITMPTAMMINRVNLRLKILGLFLSSFLVVSLFGQNDFESWNSFGVDVDLTKKTNLELSNELRLDNNAQGFKKYQVDIGANQKIFKYFSASLFYRYSRVDDLVAYVNEHLFYAKLGVSFKVNRFEFDYQTRYDRSFEVYGYKTVVKTEDAWRNKVAVEYNIYGLPINPYVSYELFVTEEKYGFDMGKYRLFGGLKYKMNQKNSFGLFYGIQKSLLKPSDSYILGIKYNLKLDFKE